MVIGEYSLSNTDRFFDDLQKLVDKCPYACQVNSYDESGDIRLHRELLQRYTYIYSLYANGVRQIHVNSQMAL